ncbi:MAG: hypothetical protein NC225_05305 [Clostridium sp.]|nr:hypothetical protein [Clostridium sp.]MCM1398884.1 hypothetical protein [Clostridium sp.]MCM1458742.1 hypothetical protein [Bacteroides sp.]
MEPQFKTASFGGYDKKAVDTYIEETRVAHKREVDELKANVLKLSETVKNLHTMREVNLNESSSTIDNLKKVNDELQDEITQLKNQLVTYKNRDEESASRYESISRTLLEARESADTLLKETTDRCEAIAAENQAECERLKNETEANCERLTNETVASCEKLRAETTSSCQEMKESTYANCDDLRRRTKEETDNLRTETENSCREANRQTQEYCAALRVETESECEELRNQARTDAYNARMAVKRECENLGIFMSELMGAVDNVVKACDDTKTIAAQQFPDLQ